MRSTVVANLSLSDEEAHDGDVEKHCPTGDNDARRKWDAGPEDWGECPRHGPYTKAKRPPSHHPQGKCLQTFSDHPTHGNDDRTDPKHQSPEDDQGPQHLAWKGDSPDPRDFTGGVQTGGEQLSRLNEELAQAKQQHQFELYSRLSQVEEHRHDSSDRQS